MKIKIKMKLDSILILILIIITIVPRSLLILSTSPIYFFDSYVYLREAIEVFSYNSIHIKVGFPFIIFLGLFLKLFKFLNSDMLVSQLFMLSLSVVLIIVIYHYAKKLSNKLFAIFTCLLISFEPSFLSFSIVPHNDIFAITMGLIALFFTTLNTKYYSILSLFFFYLTTLTRPELYPVFGIPIIIFLFYRSWKIGLRKNLFVLLSILIFYILPVIYIFRIISEYTRHSIIEKIMFFLKPNLLYTTIKSILTFYNNVYLNNIIYIIFIISFIIYIYTNIYLNFRFKIYSNLNSEFDNTLMKYCIFLIFIIDIIVITLYGYNYIIVNNLLEIINISPPIRYFLLTKILINIPLAYPISLITKKIYNRYV